eukprot:2722323-Pleurochrysis_carterae.AAC.2
MPAPANVFRVPLSLLYSLFLTLLGQLKAHWCAFQTRVSFGGRKLRSPQTESGRSCPKLRHRACVLTAARALDGVYAESH